MEKLQFRCTLKSDVVLSASPATQGGVRTLDFIPGNAFLGIAASSLYDKEDEHTWRLFHSSQVRFGDAHPSVEGAAGSMSRPRSLSKAQKRLRGVLCPLQDA